MVKMHDKKDDLDLHRPEKRNEEKKVREKTPCAYRDPSEKEENDRQKSDRAAKESVRLNESRDLHQLPKKPAPAEQSRHKKTERDPVSVPEDPSGSKCSEEKNAVRRRDHPAEI